VFGVVPLLFARRGGVVESAKPTLSAPPVIKVLGAYRLFLTESAPEHGTKQSRDAVVVDNNDKRYFVVRIIFIGGKSPRRENDNGENDKAAPGGSAFRQHSSPRPSRAGG